MRKLTAFTFLSLNGYYKGENNDTSWHRHGEEEGRYSEQALSTNNTLLFGRTTYEMMSNFWPTPMAAEMFPRVAAGMNKAEKIVFSNTLKTAKWNNSSIMSGDIAEQIRPLKSSKGNDLTILGSGSIVSQFCDAGLIDTYEIMIDPVALHRGTPLFEGMKNRLYLKLIDAKIFESGVVLLTYTNP
tara:strand:- start:320 stop:874 length:555 start_codon:yes stop_codon:yes gene_type:complete